MTDNRLNLRRAVADSAEQVKLLEEPAPGQILNRPGRARKQSPRLRRSQEAVVSVYTGPFYAAGKMPETNGTQIAQHRKPAHSTARDQDQAASTTRRIVTGQLQRVI
jgi:hypothetical protein